KEEIDKKVDQIVSPMLQEHVPPAFVRQGDDSNTKFAPPIWVMTLSENGHFVPLHIFTDYDDKGLMFRASSPPKADNAKRPQRPALGAFRVLTVIVLAVSIAVLAWIYFFWLPSSATQSVESLSPAGAPAAKDVVSPNPSGPPNPGRQTSSHSSSGDNCQAPSIWQNLALAAIVVAIWPILG